MAASVWIASPIWNWVSDSIERFRAEITPTESDWRSPNGLPMAATGVPTVRSPEWPRASGVSFRPGRVELEQRHVGVQVVAHHPGPHAVGVGELDVHAPGLLRVRRLALGDHVGVGGHVAVAVQHEARALAALAPVAAQRRAGVAEVGDHRDHAGRQAPVQPLGVEGAAPAQPLDHLHLRGAHVAGRAVADVVVAAQAAGREPAGRGRERGQGRRQARRSRDRSPLVGGQPQRERRPAAVRLGLQGALHVLGQLAGDGQAEARRRGWRRRCRSARTPGARSVSPGPSSATVRLMAPSARPADTVTCVPSGVWRSALSSRIRMI